MNEDVDAAAPAPVRPAVPELLVRHLSPAPPARRRPPAKVRLEEALGPELARRLVTSLVPAPRHR